MAVIVVAAAVILVVVIIVAAVIVVACAVIVDASAVIVVAVCAAVILVAASVIAAVVVVAAFWVVIVVVVVAAVSVLPVVAYCSMASVVPWQLTVARGFSTRLLVLILEAHGRHTGLHCSKTIASKRRVPSRLGVTFVSLG
jgi:hypothetical protein